MEANDLNMRSLYFYLNRLLPRLDSSIPSSHQNKPKESPGYDKLVVIHSEKIIGFRWLGSLYSATLIIKHRHELRAHLLYDAILLEIEQLLIVNNSQHVSHRSFGLQVARLGSQIKRVLFPNRRAIFERNQLK
jgi:hypothetical protein